jgi:hypothetical protein
MEIVDLSAPWRGLQIPEHVEIRARNRFSRESSLFLYVAADQLLLSGTPGVSGGKHRHAELI